MLNRGLAFTFRNFSTLFLLALTVTLPLHVMQDFVWNDVVAVAELHTEVEVLRGEATVDGVRAGELASWRTAGWVILVLEVAALPLLIRAARRVLWDEAHGRLPSVATAWSSALSARGSGDIRQIWGPVISLVVIAAACIGLAREAGLSASYLVPADHRWLGSALGEASARALGGALLIGAAAYLSTEAPVPAKRSSSGSEVSTLDSTSV